ncbi:hypothetical protein [Jannaschia sp. M317]|uniref:hypothetical protein n=1 Tax=Jannaschia sp. M317 TaxID=2867011 RepID=UPI0021A7B1C1|nr:hypothetical protein [Jannaschia sp. M317]UWQ18274.1 hypothetical protein K3551_02915 [Jannaschia sp. M317]
MTRFLALILCALLTLPFSSGPARADLDGDDAVRILGGLAALYLLKEALERDQTRSERARPPVRSQPRGTYDHIHADGSGGGGWHSHPVGSPHAAAAHPARPLPVPAPVQVTRLPAPYEAPRDRVDVRLIPSQCRAALPNAIEVIEGHDATCMQNAVVLPGSLPPQCLRRAGGRALYEDRCLRAEGWSPRTARN